MKLDKKIMNWVGMQLTDVKKPRIGYYEATANYLMENGIITTMLVTKDQSDMLEYQIKVKFAKMCKTKKQYRILTDMIENYGMERYSKGRDDHE